MGRENESLFEASGSHDQDGRHAPYMVKTLQKSSSPEPKGQWPWILVCSIGALGPSKIVQMMTVSWPWPILYKVKFGPLCFNMGKSVRKSYNGRNLQQMTRVTWGICLHKTFWPHGVVCPCPGLYTCIKTWKIMYKIGLQRYFLKLATNGQSDKGFLLTSGFCPQRLSAPAPGLYTCGKTLKMCIKSGFKEICLKLATNGRSDKGFLLTSIVCPQGVFCPCPGAIYMYKIIKNVYKISDFEEIILKRVTYGQREKAFMLSSKFYPQVLSTPALGLYTCIKALKYIPGPGVRWAFTGPTVPWYSTLLLPVLKIWTFLLNHNSHFFLYQISIESKITKILEFYTSWKFWKIAIFNFKHFEGQLFDKFLHNSLLKWHYGNFIPLSLITISPKFVMLLKTMR